MELTQSEAANAANIDVRTVLNIENYKGNPKMEVLYPLIRTLHMDVREIFNPEIQRKTPGISQLRLLIEECSEEEVLDLIPIIQSILSALRNEKTITLK